MSNPQLNGQVAAPAAAVARGRRARPELVHQPRAELARLQRAGAGRGARPVESAAGAAPVPGDLARRTSTSSSRSASPGSRRSSTRTSSRRTRRPTAWGPLAQLNEISRRAHDFVGRQYEVWHTEVRPQLLKHGIRVCSPDELTDAQNAYLDEYFDTQVYPVLTPAGDRPGAPVPAPAQQEPEPDPADRVRSSRTRPPALRRAPGPLGPEPPGPAARRGRRPAPVRPARGRDRPPARRPLRRLPRRRAGRPSA